jgi:iron complex outermembrane receptor protein
VRKTGFTKPNSSRQWYSDYFVEDASFFRLDDVTLGYTFRALGSWQTDVRLALGVQNPFILSRYSGLDPEVVAENGIDNTMWPRPRTFSLRLNVNF